jgi:hypothetical protein
MTESRPFNIKRAFATFMYEDEEDQEVSTGRHWAEVELEADQYFER